METLRTVLEQAEASGVAVGHFNVSDLTILKAIVAAAQELKVPVVVGASEGERRFIGDHELAAWVRTLAERSGCPIFLNADHTHSLPSAMQAAKAGFDWIVFDLSALPYEENLRQTKVGVEELKSLRPDILVEGEIGDIGSGSEIHDAAPEGLRKGLSTPAEAAHFVAETKVDTLAPAVGNMHGMLKSMVVGETKKRLDIPRIRAIKQAAKIFMTLHGASGTNDDDLRAGIGAGITVVHINTEVRVAWRSGLDGALAKQPNEIVPYKILPDVVNSVKRVVAARLALFNEGVRARPAAL